MYSQEDMVVFV